MLSLLNICSSFSGVMLQTTAQPVSSCSDRKNWYAGCVSMLLPMAINFLSLFTMSCMLSMMMHLGWPFTGFMLSNTLARAGP